MANTEIITSESKRHIGQVTWDTKALADRLAKAKTGELITYEELSGLIGRNVQAIARSNMESARDIVMRDGQIVFGVVRNIGLKRLNAAETVQTGQDSVDHIRRTSKRALRRITSLEYEALPNEMKIKHNMYASAFGVLAHMMGAPQMRRLEGRVEAAHDRLPLMKTLEAFKG